jgi:hypothetical protein
MRRIPLQLLIVQVLIACALTIPFPAQAQLPLRSRRHRTQRDDRPHPRAERSRRAAVGAVQEGYNSANERVEIPYVRVLKEDGTVVKAGDDAVQDLSAPVEHEAPVYTDYRQKHITVPGLRPGEVLEYDMVTVIHTPLAAGEFWANTNSTRPTSISTKASTWTFPPAAMKLKYKPGMDPKITKKTAAASTTGPVLTWSAKKMTRIKIKDKKKKKKHRPDDDRPDMQLTTFATWEQIGRWYAGLEKDRRAPSPKFAPKPRN